MMGIEANTTYVRAKTAIDVSFLRSKTGNAILKGGRFYDRTLQKILKQLTQDARVEISFINYQKKVLLNRRRLIMNRSYKLVQAYNLPPIKTPSATKHTNYSEFRPPEMPTTATSKSSRPTPGLGRAKEKIVSFNVAVSSPVRGADDDDSDEDSDFEVEELRHSICSPIPNRHSDDLEKGSFPNITVEKCDESLPPLHRKNVHVPEYASQNSATRSRSSNSLMVPSPVLQKRQQDGKLVSVVEASSRLSNLSRSEGSIPEAVHAVSDPRFKALEAVLRPVSVNRPTLRKSSDVNESPRSLSDSTTPTLSSRLAPGDGGRLLRGRTKSAEHTSFQR